MSVFCHHAKGGCGVRGVEKFCSRVPSGCSRGFGNLGMSVGNLGLCCVFGGQGFSCPTTFDRSAGRHHGTNAFVTNFSVSGRGLSFSCRRLPRCVRRGVGPNVGIGGVGCAGTGVDFNCTCG